MPGINNSLIESSSPNVKAIAHASVAVISWSAGAYLFFLLKNLPVLQILAIAQILGGCINCFLGRDNFKKETVKKAMNGWMLILFLFTHQVGYVYAFRVAPAAHVDLLHYLWPTILIVGGVLKGGLKFTKLQIVGILICFASFAVLFAPELMTTSVSFLHTKGYLSAFFAALSWASYNLFRENKCTQEDNALVGVEIVCSGLLCALLQSIFGGWVILSAFELSIISLIGVFSYGFAFYCWNHALEIACHSSIGAYANVIPILSVSFLVLGGIVDYSNTLAASFLLVALGCYLLGKKSLRSEEKAYLKGDKRLLLTLPSQA
jgi:drug/metabolite transporter (DMT)-like permease